VNKSKQTSDEYSHLERYDKVYGAPKAALDLYRKQSIDGKEKNPISHAHSAISSKYLTGAPLVSLVDSYASILSRNLNDKMFQVGSWTQIEDFWSFLQQVQTRCTMEALFGSALFKQYPKIVRDYWEFNTAVDSFLPGAPHFMISAASRPRERLQEGIGKWLKTNHSGSEFAKIGDEDPDWDEHKGSKFIQERDDAIAKIEGLDLQARVAEILSVMHGYVPSIVHDVHKKQSLTTLFRTNSPLVPLTFWAFLEVLRAPALAEHLSAAIARHCPPSSSSYSITDLMNIPLLASLHTEVKRLRTSTAVVRKCDSSEIKLDNHWTLPRGASALYFSHDISMNTDRWASARPRAVDKPLEEFWAERFLVPDGKESRSKRLNGTTSGSFSVEGLEALTAVFDEGVNTWAGSEFAMAMQTATLAVVLNEFEVQLCEPEWAEAVIPPVRELAFGTVKPLDKIEVRVRKRNV
jgi:hypothetical protein